MSVAARLFGWTPFRAAVHGESLQVDWCHLQARRMTDPFFYATIANAMREPFNLVFQQHTPIEALAELPQGLPIAGFVFHMSRCGSTLVSQALTAFESNIVVSEAAPLRSVLRTAASGRVEPETAARWLAGLVNAYAQARFSYEARLFVKFMAADVLDIALVRRAFPDVPWIFVTRDPAEIMASQAISAGYDLVRGAMAPDRLGLADDEVWAMDALAYQAHVLAAFARAGHDAHASGKGLILDYSELPQALLSQVLPHFGLGLGPGGLELMQHVCSRHSKRPEVAFSAEADPGRTGAAPFRAVCDPIVGPVMEALAALRGGR